MKKMLKEFKAFINKGSVMDLAVGMIIGSAFTAIVSTLVKNILTPLISWIPGSKKTNTLQTVLKPAVIDANGNVLSDALILDWGAVIGAIITFLLTALVLFFLIKAMNKIKEAGEKVKSSVEDFEKRIRHKINGEDSNLETPAQTEEQSHKELGEDKDKALSEQEKAQEDEQESSQTERHKTEQSIESLLKQIIEILQKDK